MIGLKIEFKGRVNRWRRTKIIRGISGAKILLPLYSYDTRIEFGSGKAITRKGALGIRLWFCYRPSFEGTLSEAMISYIEYSQRLKAKAVKRFLNKFKVKSRLC
jgi:ribosomal protein S3